MLLDRIQQLRSLVVCDERAIARQQQVVAALQKVGEEAIYAKRLLANLKVCVADISMTKGDWKRN